MLLSTPRIGQGIIGVLEISFFDRNGSSKSTTSIGFGQICQKIASLPLCGVACSYGANYTVFKRYVLGMISTLLPKHLLRISKHLRL